MELEQLLQGFTAAELARVCRGAKVTLSGFSKKLELAPYPLVVGALERAVSRGGAKGSAVKDHLAEVWREKNPETYATLESDKGTLAVMSREELVEWGADLGRRLGPLRAGQALTLGARLLDGLDSRIHESEVLKAMWSQWPQEAAPTQESEQTEPEASLAVEEPKGGGKKPSEASRQRENRKAAQVKELQQVVKQQKNEIQDLQRQLKVGRDREEALILMLADLKAKQHVYEAAVHETEPRARISRLVLALFEALREKEELEGEIALLRASSSGSR